MAILEITSDGMIQLGIPEMDRDHHRLIKMINAEWGIEKEKVIVRLEEIAREAITHFEREEASMGVHVHSLFVSHKKEHNRLVEDISNMIFDIKSGLEFNVEEIIKWAIKWLIEHTETQDRELAAFLLGSVS